MSGKGPLDISREEEVSFFETILFIWLNPLVSSVPNLYPLKNTFSICCTDDVGKVSREFDWFKFSGIARHGLVFFSSILGATNSKKHSDHSGVIQNIKKGSWSSFEGGKIVKRLKLLTFFMNVSNPNALGLPLSFSLSSNLTKTQNISI